MSTERWIVYAISMALVMVSWWYGLTVLMYFSCFTAGVVALQAAFE